VRNNKEEYQNNVELLVDTSLPWGPIQRNLYFLPEPEAQTLARIEQTARAGRRREKKVPGVS